MPSGKARAGAYRHAKMYMLWAPGVKGVYKGGTTLPVHERLDQHLRKYRWYMRDPTRRNKCSCHEILASGRAQIVHLYDFPCETKDEMEAQEFVEIAKLPHNTVNICRARRWSEKDKARMRAWRAWRNSHMGTLAGSYGIFH